MNEVHYTDPSKQSQLPDIDEEPVSTAEYVQNLQPIKDQKRKSKRNWIIALVLLLLAGAGAAVYLLVLNKPTEEPVATDQPTAQTEQPVAEIEAKTYTSDDLGVSFEHLSTWTVDDETQGMVTVSSPTAKLTKADGQEVDGKVVVTFLSTGSEVPVFEDTQGLGALLDSERITYESPAPGQREQTFISFGGLSTSGIDVVFVTGNNGYKKGQMIPEADIKKVDPIIGVMFYDATGTAIAIQAESWSANEAAQAALSLIKSLKVT